MRAQLVSVSGLVGHRRAGCVRAGPGVVFGLVGIGGSIVGTALHRRLNDDALHTKVAAWPMWVVSYGVMPQTYTRARPAKASLRPPTVTSTRSLSGPKSRGPPAIPATEIRRAIHRKHRIQPPTWLECCSAGTPPRVRRWVAACFSPRSASAVQPLARLRPADGPERAAHKDYGIDSVQQ